MWSHYADCHRGICVAFSRKRLECLSNHIFDRNKRRNDIWKVEYVEAFPKFDICEFLQGKIMPEAITSKSCDWCYEKEQRFVLGLKGRRKNNFT